MTRQEIVRALLAEYQTERLASERARDRREEEAEARDPELARLREGSAALVLDTARRMMSGAITREEAEKISRDMKEKGIALAAQRAERLKKMGYPADWLDVRYNCPLCRDTGYVGDVPQVFCDCFKKRLAKRLYEDGSLSGSGHECFEEYDETVYPEENGQRRQALRARDFCEKYADSFPDNERSGLLLTGTSGLGKTYLLNCIYERVTSRGYAAVRITAYKLGEIMRAYLMSQDDGQFDDLIRVPMLLIDDLGTEPMLRNVTVENLYSLINERRQAGLATVVATNLTPAQLMERYGDRVASRLLDKMHVSTILLTGRDVRLV